MSMYTLVEQYHTAPRCEALTRINQTRRPQTETIRQKSATINTKSMDTAAGTTSNIKLQKWRNETAAHKHTDMKEHND